MFNLDFKILESVYLKDIFYVTKNILDLKIFLRSLIFKEFLFLFDLNFGKVVVNLMLNNMFYFIFVDIYFFFLLFFFHIFKNKKNQT